MLIIGYYVVLLQGLSYKVQLWERDAREGLRDFCATELCFAVLGQAFVTGACQL